MIGNHSARLERRENPYSKKYEFVPRARAGWLVKLRTKLESSVWVGSEQLRLSETQHHYAANPNGENPDTDQLRLPVNEKLDPAKYHDTYTEDVKKLIEDKAKAQKREAPKPARSNGIDLVAALQESLAQKKPRKRGAA